MFKLVLEKAEEPEIKLPTSAGSSKKQESSRKTSISALLTMPKPELPVVQAGFRKGRGTRDQIANILWIIKKEKSSRKTFISALLTMPKPLTVWVTINCGKFFKRWAYQTT